MVPSVVPNDGIIYRPGGRSGVVALAVKTGGSGDVTSSVGQLQGFGCDVARVS